MKKLFLSILLIPILACQNQTIPTNIPELLDNNPTTTYTGSTGNNQLLFDVSILLY